MLLNIRSGFYHNRKNFYSANLLSVFQFRTFRIIVSVLKTAMFHDDVIKWKHCPRYGPFVRGIPRSPVISPHKGQWRGALIFSLICVWINDWVKNRKAGYLRHYRAHYDVIVMSVIIFKRVTSHILGVIITIFSVLPWYWFVAFSGLNNFGFCHTGMTVSSRLHASIVIFVVQQSSKSFYS